MGRLLLRMRTSEGMELGRLRRGELVVKLGHRAIEATVVNGGHRIIRAVIVGLLVSYGLILGVVSDRIDYVSHTIVDCRVDHTEFELRCR